MTRVNSITLQLTDKEIEKFWAKIAVYWPRACWIWKLGVDTQKVYGRVTIHGKKYRPHRIAFYLHYNIQAGSLCVLHYCDTPLCCNPSHLWLGTKAQNNTDRHLKGRDAIGTNNGRYTFPETTPRGENHCHAKLNEVQVKEIRTLYSPGKLGYMRLAKIFSVAIETIKKIVKRQAWKHVT